MTTLIRQIREHVSLHRDPRTGIAWVENGEAGIGHSCHPNISASGSARGMKAKGYWAKDDVTVKSHGFTYNVSSVVVSDDLDEIARQACQCGGAH